VLGPLGDIVNSVRCLAAMDLGGRVLHSATVSARRRPRR
jgi:hypothetical protein